MSPDKDLLLVGEWIATRRERDRTLLTLSAGGIALLVTLLSTVGLSTVGWLAFVGGLLYFAAFTSFVAAVCFGIRTLDWDAEYLETAITSRAEAKKMEGEGERLDTRVRRCFWFGVAFSLVIGVEAGVRPFVDAPDPGTGTGITLTVEEADER